MLGVPGELPDVAEPSWTAVATGPLTEEEQAAADAEGDAAGEEPEVGTAAT